MEQEPTPLEKAKRMVLSSSPKVKMSWPDRLKWIGVFFVFFVGAIGGGLMLCRILDHFHFPLVLSDFAGLVYWCAYCLLFSKVELKSDARSSYDRGYSDGYAAGRNSGSSISETEGVQT